MELRHLRYFLAVAEELHFSRAAVRLQMAQPPLSQQIKQLEAELGVQLFARTQRKVMLTAAGQVFHQEAQQLMQQLEQAVDKTQQAGRGELGRLAIAFVSSAMYSLLPDYLKQFCDRYPHIDVVLHELSTQEQIKRLLDHRLDIGFVRPPLVQSRLQSHSVLQESLVVAVPASHAFVGQKTISLKTLRDESFILFPRAMAMGLYDQIITFCQRADFSPTVVQQAAQMQTILSLVAADMGVAIVPASLENLQRRGVCFIPFDEPTPKTVVSVVWHPEQSVPVVQTFLQGLMEAS